MVKDAYGNREYSAPAMLTLKPAITYTAIADVTVAAKETASFVVEAQGEGLTYQWQYTKNGTTWYNTTLGGNTTDTLSFTANTGLGGRQYRCVLVDAYGNRVVTEPATLTVE